MQRTWKDLYVEPKKQYKWTYVQKGTRLSDVENKPMVTTGKREGGGETRSRG